MREFIFALAQSEGITIPDHQPTPCIYQTYVNPWCQHLADTGHGPHIIKRYSLIVSDFLATYPNPTRAHIQTALAHLSTLSQNPDTSATTFSALTSFFGYLANHHITPTNIAEPEDDT